MISICIIIKYTYKQCYGKEVPGFAAEYLIYLVEFSTAHSLKAIVVHTKRIWR